MRPPQRGGGGLTVIIWETSSDPGRGLVTRISNIDEPQIPVVSDDIPCSGCGCFPCGSVRPLETVAPLSGAVLNDV